MADPKKINDIASVLQQVDVGEIFTSLALGIAEAQEKLDDNSVRQLLKLSETEVAGKSLLELGFVPAFYQFDYADISANIHLTMAINEQTTFGLSAQLDLAKLKGYDKSHLDLLEKSKSDTKRYEFKSSKEVLVKSSETKSIKVQNKNISINQSEGSITKIENFEDRIREAQGITRAESGVHSEHSIQNLTTTSGIEVHDSAGYIAVHVPSTALKFGVLEVDNYTSTPAVTIKSTGPNNTFNIAADFDATMDAIDTAGIITGLGTSGLIVGIPGKSAPDGVSLEVYFGHDKRKIKESYSEGSYDNAGIEDKLEAVAEILKANPALTLTVVGHTDSSGPKAYNDDLGQVRADNVKLWLEDLGVTNQINTESESENEALGGQPEAGNPLDKIKDPQFRKAVLKLSGDADYYYFQGADFNITQATVTPTTTGISYIALVNVTIPATSDVEFSYDTHDLSITDFSTADNFITKFTAANWDDHFSYEKVGDTVYLLYNESTVRFLAYSEDEDDITMVSETSNSNSNSDSENTYYLDETVNKDYQVKKDAENIENPATRAFSASVDFRMTRGFDMSVEGSASMSARLRAVPPPMEFKDHILNNYTGN